jgi:hypothetical protein
MDVVAEPRKIGTALHALKFITAGNATFTLRSMKTGMRFTYRVSRVCCDSCKRDFAGRKQVGCKVCPCHAKAEGQHFVGVLTGPNNEQDYSYVGMLGIGPDGAHFRTTRNSRCDSSAPSVVALTWFMSKVNANVLPDDVEVWHAGKCGMCGRKLTVPSSIAIGIGPECLTRFGGM